MSVKAWIRALLPRSVMRAYHRRRIAHDSRRNAGRTSAEVFSDIYRDGTWGKGAGPFCSGLGSTSDAISAPYVQLINAHLQADPTKRQRVVDLGCGDFSVGRHLVDSCDKYVGVEVVADLVRHLQASVADPSVTFQCLDMTQDDLPAGDTCLIRQVFQHLSNEQIGRVLPKLSRYRTVFITEHYPRDGSAVVANVDKVQGEGIRLFVNSGVYLDRAPFNIPSARLELVLEVPGHEFSGLYDPGVIRTFRYSPQTPRLTSD